MGRCGVVEKEGRPEKDGRPECGVERHMGERVGSDIL